jgi:protein involved in polysaccharide export with SLBB domain
MRIVACLALVATIPLTANAQPGAPKRIRPYQVIRVSVTTAELKPDRQGGFLLVEGSGRVDLEKLQEGFGRVKVSGTTVEEAKEAITVHLKARGHDRAVSVKLLEPERISEELIRQRAAELAEKSIPMQISYLQRFADELRHSLKQIPQDEQRQRLIRPHSVVAVYLDNVDSKHRSVGKTLLVSESGTIDLVLREGSYGRIEIAGKTQKEAASAIVTHLRPMYPKAAIELHLYDVGSVEKLLASKEREMKLLERQLKQTRTNIQELSEALPLD